MKRLWASVFSFLVFATPAVSQFVGPSEQGRAATVAEAETIRAGSYIVVSGNIISHLRGDYFTFRDSTGEIRVEIGSGVWRGREVKPETTVRLLGEVDRGPAGRYLWVKSLEIIE